MRKYGITLLFLLLSSLFIHPAMAACNFSPNSTSTATSVKQLTAPLAITTISIPPGTPVGTVVYQQNISLSAGGVQGARIVCSSSGAYRLAYGYKSTPLPQTTAGSRIYKTGIEGLGIKFIYDNQSFPYSYATSNCTNSTNCSFTTAWTAASNFQLIKTADTVDTGILAAANLPVALYSFGQSSSMVGIYEITLSGSLTVTRPTCDVTPASQSMVVQMGSHRVADFNGMGSGTPWQNASIQLHNCGWFYGNSQTSVGTFNGAENINVVSGLNNLASVSLLPGNGILRAADGIMKITAHAAQASGVGIQLSSSASESGKINLNAAYKHTLPNDGSSLITIPLYARYIQTATPLTAGRANGILVYSISYQ